MRLIIDNVSRQRFYVTSAHDSYENCLRELVKAGNELEERINGKDPFKRL